MPREERLRAWQERTGKSEPALYRRLADVDVFSDGEREKVRMLQRRKFSMSYRCIWFVCFRICFSATNSVHLYS